jgi:membrane protein DedA with SNARE-associated domain
MPEVLHELLGQAGYLILFVTVLLMNGGVPLPGHLAYVGAAILAGRGTFSLPLVMIAGCIAAILGALGGFAVGQRGGRRLIEVHGRRVGLSGRRLEALDRFFVRHGAKAVLLTRFFVVIRTFGALFAGVSQVPPRRFLLVTTAGAVAWAGVFGTAGFIFGDQWHVVEAWLGRAGLVFLGLGLAAAVARMGWTRCRRTP